MKLICTTYHEYNREHRLPPRWEYEEKYHEESGETRVYWYLVCGICGDRMEPPAMRED